MELTQRELKLISRLRDEERKWPRTRWYVLVGCIFILLMQSYNIYQVADFMYSNGPEGVFAMAAIYFFVVHYPMNLIMLLLAFSGLGWVSKNWQGNVNRMLLLKLLDEKLKESAN